MTLLPSLATVGRFEFLRLQETIVIVHP